MGGVSANGRGAIIVSLAAATAFLMTPAIINHFPLMFPDSLDYIILTPRLYRSPFYQMFVFIIGWKQLIWLTIFFQAFLASLVIWYLLRTTIRVDPFLYTVVVAVFSWFTSLAIFVSFLMPDVFTGLMFACLYLLMFCWNRLEYADRLLIAACCAACVAMHLSHLLMAVAMILACAAVRLAGLRWMAWRGLATTACCAALVGGLTFTYNIIVFGAATLSPAGSTFLLANLIEYGPARTELRETCPRAGYRMCRYVDQLPPLANDFLWTEGPLSELGGFVGMRSESGHIVAATIQHRPLETLAVSAQNTTRALTSVWPATDIVPLQTRHQAALTVGKVYGPAAAEDFSNSRQQFGTFPREAYDTMALAGLIVSIATLLVLVPWAIAVGRHRLIAFPLFSIAAFIGNAATCATLSGVFDRYQSRASWLIVVAALLLVFDVVSHRRSLLAEARLRQAVIT